MTHFIRSVLVAAFVLALGTAAHAQSSAGTNATISMIMNANNQWNGMNSFALPPQVPPLTVATLPTCTPAIDGSIAMVTDATTPTYNGTLTGGSNVVVLALCTGAAWKAH